MPFYGKAADGGSARLETKSKVDQGKEGNCYIMAPLAAHSLAGGAPNIAAVQKAVGFGMGGNSNRAFTAMGLFGLTVSDPNQWRSSIEAAVGKHYPLCLGIHWKDLPRISAKTGKELKPKAGNHVIYAIGYEAALVYARDQQNKHVLISVRMAAPWESEEFAIGLTSRTCTLKWIGIGFPSRDAAKALLTPA